MTGGGVWVGGQALLEQAEKELLEARRAHDDLLDRIVAEKSRNAEEMNNMNAMIEELKATLRAQGLPTPRAKVGYQEERWYHF